MKKCSNAENLHQIHSEILDGLSIPEANVCLQRPSARDSRRRPLSSQRRHRREKSNATGKQSVRIWNDTLGHCLIQRLEWTNSAMSVALTPREWSTLNLYPKEASGALYPECLKPLERRVGSEGNRHRELETASRQWFRPHQSDLTKINITTVPRPFTVLTWLRGNFFSVSKSEISPQRTPPRGTLNAVKEHARVLKDILESVFQSWITVNKSVSVGEKCT